jgi:hypothetical protein
VRCSRFDVPTRGIPSDTRCSTVSSRPGRPGRCLAAGHPSRRPPPGSFSPAQIKRRVRVPIHRRMAAATPPDGVVTPELALVDPELAVRLRDLHADRETAADEDCERRVSGAWPTESLDALHRLVDLCDVEPLRRARRFEAAKIGLAVATWGTFALLLLETQGNSL